MFVGVAVVVLALVSGGDVYAVVVLVVVRDGCGVDFLFVSSSGRKNIFVSVILSSLLLMMSLLLQLLMMMLCARCARKSAKKKE